MRRALVLFVRSLVSLVAAGYLFIQPEVSPAVAAQLTSQQVNQFLADPSGLLKNNPDGGGRLVSTIRDLMMANGCAAPVGAQAATCEQVLKTIVGLLANANDAQQTAIGQGLGDAAQSMVSSNPTLANDIQTALAASGSKLAVASYQSTVGNEAIGAAGGGGGGGGAAYESNYTGGGGGGGGGTTSTSGTGTSGFGLTSGGGVPSSTPGTTTTVAAAVSPI